MGATTVYVVGAVAGSLIVMLVFTGSLWKRISIGAVIGLAIVAAL